MRPIVLGANNGARSEVPAMRCRRAPTRYSPYTHLRQILHGSLDGVHGVFIVIEPAIQVRFVGTHVEVAVARQVEEYDAFVAFCLGVQRLIDGRPDGVG